MIDSFAYLAAFCHLGVPDAVSPLGWAKVAPMLFAQAVARDHAGPNTTVQPLGLACSLVFTDRQLVNALAATKGQSAEVTGEEENRATRAKKPFWNANLSEEIKFFELNRIRRWSVTILTSTHYEQ